MFSNGTEYSCFLSKNCEYCKKSIPWNEIDESKFACHIDVAINMAMDDSKHFPYQYLKENGSSSRYDCIEFESVFE